MSAFIFVGWLLLVSGLLLLVAVAASRFGAAYRHRIGGLPSPEEQLRALAEHPAAALRGRTRASWNAYFTRSSEPGVDALRERVFRRLGLTLATALGGLPLAMLLARVADGEDISVPGGLFTVLLSGLAVIWAHRATRSARRGDTSPRWLIATAVAAILTTAVAGFAALRT